MNKPAIIIFIIVFMFSAYSKTTFSTEVSHDIIVIARHGSLENTPENTFAAFQKAADIGVRGLEVDVRMTIDGKLVLMHDATIDRTTNGNGYVNKLLYEEIKLYDAGSWKNDEFAGEKVPLLSETLQFAKERTMKLILNVKEHGIEQKILALIEEFDMIHHVYFSGTLESLRNEDLDVKGAQLIFLQQDKATADVINAIHQNRDHVGTRLFGTDDRDKMKEHMFQGIDIILTDHPSVAIDLLHFRTINIPKIREPVKRLETNIVGNTAQIGVLLDTITHDSPDQSRMAALIFSTLPAERAVPPLIQRLDYKNPLKRFIPKMNIPFFNKGENKENEDFLPANLVQMNIVWALGLIKNKSAVEPLIKRLDTADSDLKREIIQALKMIGDEKAIPALEEMLRKDKNPFVRYDAARALGVINNTVSAYALIDALKTDKSWLVKGGCAGALENTRDNRAIYELKALLNTDAGKEASWARDKAAWALSKAGNSGIEALVSSLGAVGKSTRRRACWALIEIGDPSVQYLISALKDVSKSARGRAAIALGWIGNKKAVLPLSWALTDSEPEVRKMAAWALGKIGDTTALPALEQTLGDHDENVVKYVNEAIQRINYN